MIERARALAGIQRSVASGISVSKPASKPAPQSAAEVWENRNKDILREYYINKEAAARNKAAVRGEHGLAVDYREVRFELENRFFI